MKLGDLFLIKSFSFRFFFVINFSSPDLVINMTNLLPFFNKIVMQKEGELSCSLAFIVLRLSLPSFTDSCLPSKPSTLSLPVNFTHPPLMSPHEITQFRFNFILIVSNHIVNIHIAVHRFPNYINEALWVVRHCSERSIHLCKILSVRRVILVTELHRRFTQTKRNVMEKRKFF